MKSEEEIMENIAIKQGVIESVEALGFINSIGKEVIEKAQAQIRILEWILED